MRLRVPTRSPVPAQASPASRPERFAALLIAPLSILYASGCGTDRTEGRREQPGLDGGEVRLTDVTAAAGVSFVHEAGARGDMLTPETFGPGAAWLDVDNDSRIDLFLTNGNLLRGELDSRAHPVLYRNLGGGKFADATREAGLEAPIYGMGAVSADTDNDGDQDLLVYGLHRSIYYPNDGGRFRDATRDSGLDALRGWVGAAAFLDYDRDGKLDLFVGNYVTWSPEREAEADCTFGTARKNYCPIAVFPPSPPQLFRGRGNGTFEETTQAAGLAQLAGKSLGVAVEDYDRDGWPDVFVANDTVPNFCLRNRGDGTFEDRGLDTGFAVSRDGAPFAGMGIDTAWLPDGGPLMVVVGNFAGEPTTVHVLDGGGGFLERSQEAGVGRATLDRVTFGCELLDWNLDGALDLALANGHVFDVERITLAPYRQRTQIFLGRGGPGVEGAFVEARAVDSESFLQRAILGRALASADYDGDGDLDIVVTENQGPVHLLRNDLPTGRNWVRVDLEGTRSNRDAIGAEVTLWSRSAAGSTSVRRTRKAVASYLSQPERTLTFGLKPDVASCDAEVSWPSGLRERFPELQLRSKSRLVEGTGRALSAAEVAGAAQGAPPASATGPVAASPPGAGARREALDLLRQGRWAEAAPLVDEALRRAPGDIQLLRARITALAQAGRKDDASRRSREVFAAYPDAHVLVSQFAVVFREMGIAELAARFYEEAARLAPERYDVWVALGNLEFDASRYETAVGFYDRALRLEPASLEALTNQGKALTALKDYRRARERLERALAINPRHSAALGTLGGVAIEEGNLDAAQALLERAIEAARSKEARIGALGNLGILYARRGDRVRARDCFEQVLAIDPGDARARRALEKLAR